MNNLKNWKTRKLNKVNWGFIVKIIYWTLLILFVIYVSCQFIELRAKIRLNNSIQKYDNVVKLKANTYKIAMFKENYWCPVDAEICNTIVNIADKYGVDGQVMINLGWCESRLSPIPGKKDPRDRGWFQINSHYHPNISDDCAYDLECSANYTALLISQGKGYLWVCWK